ncbi:FadR family transcriptional regulator [Prescottella agglutinans]|uniref:FadR family transcriptional regulator n=1 Tax=Prescottella agglutinans TaxID=1644129 RepID=A0A3S3AKG7_9NOCA|nr:GntR family transcriptional regulator [Prescottella agglutinans]RVW06843.1 FadR family transcriptional regulator [Prescottella agglutinans]
MTVGSKSTVVRVPKAGELVAANLRRRIITGELGAGDPLPNESVLMEQFGVSRPTLREAFRILESESIITVLRGARGGARVMAPDPSVAARYTGLLLQYKGTPLVDVYRARASLEVSAVGVLAGPGHAEQLDVLAESIARGADLVGDAAAFAHHDVQLHQSLVDLAGNETLSVLAGMLAHIIDAHNSLFIASHGDDHDRPAARAAQRAYTKLLAYLRSGDAVEAQSFWQKNLDGIEKYMVGDSETTLVEILS